jgi:hypothetical protein
MKSIVFLLCFIIYLIGIECLCQTEVVGKNKIYETEYNNRIVIIRKDSLQEKEDYQTSIQQNLNALSTDREVSFYRLSISYSLLNELDSAFYYLNKYINCSKDDRLIILDKNFDNLRLDSTKWKIILGNIESLYLSEIDSATNKALALRLFHLGIEDQKYRLYLPALGQVETDSNGVFKMRVTNDLVNEVEDIVKKYGIPKISEVGKLASKNMFLLIQHSPRIKWKYYREIKRLYLQNEFNPLDYALLRDAYLVDRNRKQIYGTQMVSAYKRRWKKKYEDKMILYPVRDFTNVNQRRFAIGFKSTVEEYVSSWNDPNYIIPSNYYVKCEK